ncbi:MAG: hypothetical protein K8J08_02295 [Thermoanaerobaculia bacterium]|nr:hypothetical protein [Thermoanaerobaculia bacterium]
MILSGSCGGGFTSVEMTRRIDLLDAFGSRPTDRVTRFQLGNELGAPWLTEVQWTSEFRALPAAGGESPPCNDGTKYRLRKEGERTSADLFRYVEVIGDTGDADISDDRDCSCDTHVSRLLLNAINFEPSTVAGLANLEYGKEALCPNELDDLVLGGRNFDGPVDVDLTGSLRVIDGRAILEVTYFVRSAG